MFDVRCRGVVVWSCLLFTLSTLRPASALAAIDLNRRPDSVIILADDASQTNDLQVDFKPSPAGLRIRLSAPNVAVKTVRLRWNGSIDPATQCLGDAWERAYGELGWKPLAADRPMPWYFLASTDDVTDGYGVMTGPASMCCWTADANGVTLTADVRSGGVGVQLGNRVLDVCTVVCRAGHARESAFDAGVALCRQMCPHPRTPKLPVYGFNDWYCTYGNNTAEHFLRDGAALVALAPAGVNRPFLVVDDGWQANRQGGKSSSNQWDRTNAKFGSTMPQFARSIRAMHAKAGLWYRPLEAWADAPREWIANYNDHVFDPSVPAVRKQITENMRRFHDWGFDLVKHDFSTSEIVGMWGIQMGDSFVHGNRTFADRTHTTAEIITMLYQAIRDGGGDGMTIEGCDTVSHLSAGLFELQRIGDDTSGTDWKRTVDMGVNCLAFRSMQQGAFYGADPDCVGLAGAGAVPWSKNSQWLDLVARSGTPLFVSWRADLLDDPTREGIRAAFAAAAKPQPTGHATDWMSTKLPANWILDHRETAFSW